MATLFGRHGLPDSSTYILCLPCQRGCPLEGLLDYLPRAKNGMAYHYRRETHIASGRVTGSTGSVYSNRRAISRSIGTGGGGCAPPLGAIIAYLCQTSGQAEAYGYAF